METSDLNFGLVCAMMATGKFEEAITEIAIYGYATKPEWLVLREMSDLAQQRLDVTKRHDAVGCVRSSQQVIPT